MHEGAVCLGMQRRGEGTLPKHPGNWGTGPSQEALTGCPPAPAGSITPQVPSAHTAMAALPAPAQNSSHLVLSQEAHV